MAYRMLNDLAPPHLNQLVPVYSLPCRRRLRSSFSFTLQLHVLPYRLLSAGRRSVPVAASIFWNTLLVCRVYFVLPATAKDILVTPDDLV